MLKNISSIFITLLESPGLPVAQIVPVELPNKSYQISIDISGLQRISEIEFWAKSSNRHFVIITDQKVAGHYLSLVSEQFKQLGHQVDVIEIPEGEQSKSISQLEDIWNRLLKLKCDRKSCVVALGGGVVGDLAGFVAASFTRGLDFVQIPTSLLAQVDSSVGGKTGINLPGAKNMVGAFWQPKFVLIDPSVLQTLDEDNYCAGLAEVIKYGMILDRDFFNWLEENISSIKKRDESALTYIIARSCELKAEVVVEDEHETTGRRKILNYGHTFGHAIESVFGYGQYLHGQAVAIGMHCAAKLAARLGRIDDALVQRQLHLIESLGLPTTVPSGREQELVAAMHSDKKVESGKLRLILPVKIGAVELCDAPGDDWLREAF